MNFFVFAILLFWTAALQPARAEIMQGQRMIVIGLGQGSPLTELNAFQNTDFDQDGKDDNLRHMQRMGSNGISGFLQFNYFVLSSLGIGLEINAADFPTNTVADINMADYSASGGRFSPSARGKTEMTANLKQCLAVLRYVIAPDRSLNPYLLTGIGLNAFQASHDGVPLIDNGFPLGSARLQPTHWNRSSIGASFAVGGGVQTTLRDKIVIGTEARWSYSTIDSAKFGTSAVSYSAFYFWMGYKWTAPF